MLPLEIIFTDRFSHDLKKPVPPNHLICFHGKGNFRNSHKSLSSGVLEENTTVDIESDSDRRENEGSASGGENSESSSEDCTGDEIIDSAKLIDRKEVRCDSSFLSSQDSHGIDRIDAYSGDDNKSKSSEDKDINSSESEESHGFNENDLCDNDSTMSFACQRIVEYNCVTKKEKCNENLIKSQLVIMSSCDDWLSSDESVISVGNYVNPFGDIKVDDIPMEIVEDLHTEHDSVMIMSSHNDLLSSDE